MGLENNVKPEMSNRKRQTGQYTEHRIPGGSPVAHFQFAISGLTFFLSDC
jgi:hypothetical protein